VTDAGLVNLKGLNDLVTLDLDGTSVTDDGLANLKGLRNLQRLDLSNTQVTDEGVAALQKSLSRCEILH
jgi:Leucine-rich repeat (LRR) protein